MTKLTPTWELEQQLYAHGAQLIAGVDEAGRGALCGPVVAAAVILPPLREYPFRDSKALTAPRRQALAQLIRNEAIAYATGFASADEVDRLNVLAATKLAAERAIEALSPQPDALLTDFLKLSTPLPLLAVAKADARSYQVAAASILAKTVRDDYMAELSLRYPEYGLQVHKGYGVRAHLAALAELGPCKEHRLTFAPVAQASFPHAT